MMANALASLIFVVIGLVALTKAFVAGPFAFFTLLSAIVGLLALAVWNRKFEDAQRAVKEAAASVSTVWLNDVFEETTYAPRDELLALLSLDEAWAFARLQDQGIPASFVAEKWSDDAPLDADAIVAAYRSGRELR
jgi:hypothetical protein